MADLGSTSVFGDLDVTGEVSGDGSGLTALSAPVKTALNATGSAPVYACRAWVNFNGTGTVAIRASGNVSSITDNGTGDYTVNFTTAMPDEGYSVQTTTYVPTSSVTRAIGIRDGSNKTTTDVRTQIISSNGTPSDQHDISVSIFR